MEIDVNVYLMERKDMLRGKSLVSENECKIPQRLTL